MSFGTILKKIRQDNKLTQEELAKKINTSRSNIANYENDKNMPSIDILEKLSEIFGVSTDYLLGKSDVRNPEKTINDEDVKIVADSGILGLNDYNRQVAIDIIKGLKAKQDIDEKNKKD